MKPKREPELISPEEIEAEGGPSVEQQKYLRRGDHWLRYVMLGGPGRGMVRYFRADWRAYLAARTRANTKDKPGSGSAPPDAPTSSEAEVEGGCTPDDLEKLAHPHRTRAA